MKILALEFSSEQRSVAVWDGARLRGRAQEMGGRASHALTLTEAALREAGMEREQIECVVVGIGPGSYAGIRSAIALAQGWQLARGVKLLAVSSVECVAVQARVAEKTGNVHVVVDAQRGDLYLATYEVGAGEVREVGALRIVSLAEAQAEVAKGGAVIGAEAAKWFPAGETIFPDAGMLAGLAAGRGDFVSGDKLEPIYLREVSFVKAPPGRVVV